VVVARRLEHLGFAKIIVVGAPDELDYMCKFATFEFVSGGVTRQESLRNALACVQTELVFSHDVARACIETKIFDTLLDAKDGYDCVIPAIKAQDTTLLNGENLDRDKLALVQTPQLSRTLVLKKAIELGVDFTDDSSAIRSIGGTVNIVAGDKKALKLTHLDDLSKMSCLQKPSSAQFVGFGTDTHAFEDGKDMKLGGVHIPSNFGFKAHSDGDVLIHAIIDALLGAAGAGDIGEWFPDTDMRYKNANSMELLLVVKDKIIGYGFEIVNIDATISLEQPKLKAYKLQIAQTLSKLLDIAPHLINIKATTGEKLGFIGRGEGALVQALANLKFYDWKNACES
jgi:2-C-methyl-D-erythritol 4-phosphate cytidylyltransferase/2-C-methyl-D-erythritol 2,4-cyclodiphosphate synthase